MKIFWLIWGFTALLYALTPDKTLLYGDKGGYLDGRAYSFMTNSNRIRLIFYVDPDEKSDGALVDEALFKLEKRYGTEAFKVEYILNLDATWIPNTIIRSKMRSKQKELPHRDFILDNDKILVSRWHLKDDAYNLMLFDANNTLLLHFTGTITPQRVNQLKQTLKELLGS